MLAGCTAGAGGALPGGGPSPPRAAVASEHVASVVSSRVVGRLGAVLVDDTGRTLYAMSGELAPPTTAGEGCDAGCRRAWPLLLAPAAGPPDAGGEVRKALLAVVRLADGTTAATYAGHLLHTYVGDAGPGGASGHGVQHLWACVTVTGEPAAGQP